MSRLSQLFGSVPTAGGPNREDSQDGKEQDENNGVALEMIVEIRKLVPGECRLDSGQTLRDKRSLIEATKRSGVKIAIAS